MFTSHVLPSEMDFHSVDRNLGAPMVTYISLLNASMVAHAQDPYYRFHSSMVRTCRPFRSLPIATPLGFVLTILELRNIELITS